MIGKKLKFIQINIYKGKYLEGLIDFLKAEKPDIIAMQEVTSGLQNLCDDHRVNIFVYLKDRLKLSGVFNWDVALSQDPRSVMGNAVFCSSKILEYKVVTLKKPMRVTSQEVEDPRFFPYCPRHLLDAVVEIDNRPVHVISWHGAWTAPPTDNRETQRQARIAVGHLQSLSEPFLLGGDLNAIPQSKTIQMISHVANNLMEGSGVVQTTHPTVHKIVPRGFLIDYIFTSSHFKVKSLNVPQITVSDHLPVIASLEYKG